MRGADRGEQNYEEEMARYYKRRRLSYRRRPRRRYFRRRYRRRFRRGYLRRRINRRRGMYYRARIVREWTLWPRVGGANPGAIAEYLSITPDSIPGFLEIAARYEYYRIDKVMFQWQTMTPANRPGSGVNSGFFWIYPDYDGVGDDQTVSPYSMSNNALSKCYNVDLTPRFSITIRPKVRNMVERGYESARTGYSLPKRLWLDTYDSTGVQHYGVQTYWQSGAQIIGAPVAPAATELFYRYKAYISFRQKRGEVQ